MNDTNAIALPNDNPSLAWSEPKPGRWLGISPKGAKYVIDSDNEETPIGGAFYSLARLTDAPAGMRPLGGASELRLAQDMALRHLTVGAV